MVHLLACLLAFTPISPAVAEAKARRKPALIGTGMPEKSEPATGVKKSGAKARAASTTKPVESDVVPDGSVSVKAKSAPNATIAPEDIVEFHVQPAGVRKLIETSLSLAGQNLTYTYGSADPASGGLDCSGFIYYVLRQHGLTQVPRDASGLYMWVRKAGKFRAVISRKPDSFEMDELLPGDLLFWIGTYATDHDPPVTHTMIYLGTEKASGAKIMIGSSDGRAYRGQKRNGVSVFDFTMPRTPVAGDQRATFIGYARIPGLRD